MTRSGFNVNGLPGYRVESYQGEWELLVSGPHSFEYNPATGTHDIPIVCDRWSLAMCKTAKAAVARAHKHAEWVKTYKTESV